MTTAAIISALLYLLKAANGVLASGHTTGVQYEIPRGEYLPTAWERLSSVTSVTAPRCTVECFAHLSCNSFQFEQQTGTCLLGRVADSSCSTNAVSQGTVFYQKYCPSGWWLFDSHCYGFTPDVKLSWNEAKAACGKLGAHLVSLQSQEELEFLVSEVKDSASEEETWLLWTSGRKRKYEQSLQGSANWFWDDFLGGSMDSYHPWLENNPDEGGQKNYVALVSSSREKWGLASEEGSEIAWYLCENH